MKSKKKKIEENTIIKRAVEIDGSHLRFAQGETVREKKLRNGGQTMADGCGVSCIAKIRPSEKPGKKKKMQVEDIQGKGGVSGGRNKRGVMQRVLKKELWVRQARTKLVRME